MHRRGSAVIFATLTLCSFSERSHQRSPTFAYRVSVMQRFVGHPYSLTPFKKCARFPRVLVVNAGSPVANLVCGACPSAVVRGIPFIVVDALDGHCWRTQTHVLDERLKRALPPLANFDSAPPVVLERLGRWVSAPLAHSHPYVVRSSMAETVPEVVSGGSGLHLQTAAGLSATGSEIAAGDFCGVPALARKRPNCSCATTRNDRNCGKAPEFLSSKINKCHSCNCISSAQERHNKCTEAQ